MSFHPADSGSAGWSSGANTKHFPKNTFYRSIKMPRSTGIHQICHSSALMAVCPIVCYIFMKFCHINGPLN